MNNIVKPLMSLVDTLHLGFYISSYKLTEKDYKYLDECKQKARERKINEPQEMFKFQGKYFYVTSAKQHYAWVLYNDDITVRIARHVNGNFPEVYLEYRSRLLMAGLKDVHNAIKEWVESWADIKSEKVSRADIATDYQGSFDIAIDNVVMRSRNSIEHHEGFRIYRESRNITGYTFGSGPIMLRIYNKSHEITKSRKQYMMEEWKVNGWDGKTPVWRVEAQLRRDILKEFQIETVQDLIDISPDTWRYITGEWFTVRVPSDKDKTRSRWLLSEMWQTVHKSFSRFGELTGIVREKIKNVCIDNMIPQIAGLLTSLSALMKKEIIDFREVNNRVNRHYSKQGKAVQEIIDKKLKRFALFEETVGYE